MINPLDILRQSSNPEVQRLVREHEARELQARKALLAQEEQERKARKARKAQRTSE